MHPASLTLSAQLINASQVCIAVDSVDHWQLRAIDSRFSLMITTNKICIFLRSMNTIKLKADVTSKKHIPCNTLEVKMTFSKLGKLLIIIISFLKVQYLGSTNQDGFVVLEELNLGTALEEGLHLNCKEYYLTVSNIMECSALCLDLHSPLSQSILESQNITSPECQVYLFEENTTFLQYSNCLLCLTDENENFTRTVSLKEDSQLFKFVPNITGKFT